jgi:hypothetical protein
MSTPLETADLLDKAADHIERYGWTQDEFHTDDAKPMECPVCLRGGLSVAAGQHPMFSEEPYENAAHPVVYIEDDRELGEEDDASLAVIETAQYWFAEHLKATGVELAPGVPAPDQIARWNDDERRTKGEVITELRACAARIRQAEVTP